MAATTDELAARAYAVFGRYPKKVTPTVATWLSETELRKRVKTTRLRALACEDVASVWWNATGDERSLKHFLPRVLECVGCRFVTLSDVQQRLRTLATDSWPDDEREVVREILAAEEPR